MNIMHGEISLLVNCLFMDLININILNFILNSKCWSWGKHARNTCKQRNVQESIQCVSTNKERKHATEIEEIHAEKEICMDKGNCAEDEICVKEGIYTKDVTYAKKEN